MSQIFQLNASSFTRLTRVDWQDNPADQESLSGVVSLSAWRRLVAQGQEGISMTEWDTLYALEGTQVSVTCPDYLDRNATDYVTYYRAEVERIDGRHEGPNVVGVTVEIKVRI